jgi:selenocysteine-specific elongation factor
MPHVIGTAGHVDHGKSALVLALTGSDPDRLAEEKARGMTIDLGFAWTRLPSGREVGFVDVPGHERFVHNMLAGVGGVDCALFVVDASEGWRPQSTEHLAILDLLGIRTGVIALTKVDLVDDASRARVTDQVAARVAGTGLDGAEIVPTAAPAGVGLDALRAALDRALDRIPEPVDRGRPRLAVDRVFSVRGSGTVVTGTLTGGKLGAELEVELLPVGRRVRVRALQSHGHPVTSADPARRLAVNLAGVTTDQVARGDVLALPRHWAPTRAVDCRLRCLPSAPAPLRARGAYLVYAGAAETAARLQPIDADEVPAGEDALVRLHLEHPLVLDVLEPVVLRDSGRDETVGGGRVLDPFPRRAVRGTSARVRRAEELEAREAALAREDRASLLDCVLAERGSVAVVELPRLVGTGPGLVEGMLAVAVASGRALRSRSLAWSPSAWETAQAAVLQAVERHHREEPLAPGLSVPAARQVAPGAAEVVETLLEAGLLVLDGPAVRLPSHGVRLDPRQEATRARVEAAIADRGVAVLSEADLADLGADRKLVAVLSRQGTLAPVAPGLYLGTRTLEVAVATLRRTFPDGAAFTASQARATLGTTRKTVIPLLEHLDRSGITVRAGDNRRLAPTGATP